MLTLARSNVINKNIFYSDNILTLKDKGDNLKITSIKNISESILEECLKTIFDSNSDVIFNTIQYSKNNKKLYFYANKDIDTSIWEEKRLNKYNPVSSSKKILEEFKNVFNSEKNNNNDTISLYQVLTILKSEKYKFDMMKELYNSLLQRKLSDEHYGSSVYIGGFDYESNELEIRVKNINNFKSIYFSKENNDLYIKKSETCNDKEILILLGNTLSNLYDDFKKYKSLNKEYSYDLRTLNSNFFTNICKYGVDIYTNFDRDDKYRKEFVLTSSSHTNNFGINCNSNEVINAIRGNENELYKKIYVKIDDCPKWMKPYLQDIKEEELEEEKKKEEVKEKKLKLRRKLFPWKK